MANRVKIFGHLGALLTIMAWASSFSFSKVLLEDAHLTPAETYIYRFALAYIFLLPFTWKKMFADNWKDELQLALCGICSGTLYFIMENHALKITSVANVSLLSALSPLFTALFMALVYRVKLHKGVIIATPIAIVGVALVILAPGIARGIGFKISPVGDMLALACAVSWGIYSVGIKRILPLYNTFFITRKMFFYGVLTALPLLFIEHQPSHLNVLFDYHEPQYILNMLFLVLICSLMGYIFWNECIKILGPVACNNYIYSQPAFSMVVGTLWLGEPVYALAVIGCVLIIGALIICDKIT